MNIFQRAFAVLVTCLLVTACSSTIVTQSWKDEQFNAPLGKVMVLGVSENVTARRSFEQKMVNLFKEKGVDAVAGYELLPGDEKLEKEQVIETAASNNIQNLLVVRVASVKQMKETRSYTSGDVYYGSGYQNRYYSDRYNYNRNWYNYYGRHYSDAYSVQNRQFEIEWKEITTGSTLYEFGNENMIWSATFFSESDKTSTTIDELTKAMIKQLQKDGVL